MNSQIVKPARASLLAAILTGLSGFVSQAVAAPPHWAQGRHPVDKQFDDARVLSVDPIIRRVRSEEPRRECWEEVETVYREPSGHGETAGPMILGGIIGGVIGSQVGGGRGQDVATVAGTLIGATLGHDSAVRRSSRAAVPEERIVERCRTRYEDSYAERIEGYRVTYEYLGRQYTTRMPHDPGDWIRVRVAVSPAEY